MPAAGDEDHDGGRMTVEVSAGGEESFQPVAACCDGG